MSWLSGSEVSDPNYILRFAVIAFMAVVAFSSVLFWKSQLLFAAEYQEFPVTHQQLKIKKENEQKKKNLANKLVNFKID